jgi:hypothetical protein
VPWKNPSQEEVLTGTLNSDVNWTGTGSRSMHFALYLTFLLVAVTLIAFAADPLVQPVASTELRKLEWVRDSGELRKISQNSPYMRNER